MSVRRQIHLAIAGITASCVLGGLMSGCTTNRNSLEAADLSRQMACVDDSPRCLAARKRALDALIADREHTWLQRKATANAYASGVRLFALKKSKRNLTCQQLAAGIAEAGNAPEVLRGRRGGHLKPGQISRGVMLGNEVTRELKRERAKRCS